MDRKILAENVAKALLSIKAVFLRPSEPFTWASGIKSPVYCDNRLTLAYPEVRAVVENGIAVMGTSTAGIPHAAIVSEKLNLPMGYVRSGNKEHGRGNRIEGADPKGKKVVVVEDLISTGGSAVEVAEALREAGGEVIGIVSIFTYEMKKGYERLAAAGVRNESLSNFSVLSKVALDEKYITEKEYRMVTAFREDPTGSGWLDVK